MEGEILALDVDVARESPQPVWKAAAQPEEKTRSTQYQTQQEQPFTDFLHLLASSCSCCVGTGYGFLAARRWEESASTTGEAIKIEE